MKYHEMNLYLNNKKHNNERSFHKELFKYIKKYTDKCVYEKFFDREMRPDIYFEHNNKKYILECKYISNSFSHKDIAAFLIQMFNYRQLLGDNYIYLCAICGDDEIIEKKFGTGFLYPSCQLFASFGFYFLKWDKDLPKHFNSPEKTFLSYSNGSGIMHLKN